MARNDQELRSVAVDASRCCHREAVFAANPHGPGSADHNILVGRRHREATGPIRKGNHVIDKEVAGGRSNDLEGHAAVVERELPCSQGSSSHNGSTAKRGGTSVGGDEARRCGVGDRACVGAGAKGRWGAGFDAAHLSAPAS